MFSFKSKIKYMELDLFSCFLFCLKFDLYFLFFCRVLVSGFELCCFNYYKVGFKCKGINI